MARKFISAKLKLATYDDQKDKNSYFTVKNIADGVTDEKANSAVQIFQHFTETPITGITQVEEHEIEIVAADQTEAA